jgi:hypothetical protein
LKILLAAIVVGLISGLIRAKFGNRPYQPYHLRHTWLVLIALIPQWLVFNLPLTRATIPDVVASASLVLSQLILLVFAWANRKTAGFWLLGLGLLLNLAVVVSNGGFMPISPETVRWLAPDVSPNAWSIGERLGTGKDIVLLIEETNLYFLSDRLRTPNMLGYRVAFSVGDVLIALGAFWLLWSIGGPVYRHSKQENIK